MFDIHDKISKRTPIKIEHFLKMSEYFSKALKDLNASEDDQTEFN